MAGSIDGVDAARLFGDYMKVTGVPDLDPAPAEDPALAGKRLGVVNGASWTSLWISWFGRALLPGVELVQVGSDAVQLHFMEAHRRGAPCPPPANIDLFRRYARDLFELRGVDAVLISCSTMNRAFRPVRETMEPLGVPVVQIDEAMMEEAVRHGGRVLVVATHGPTVESTQALLRETAERLGRSVDFAGATIERAFDLLGEGRIEEHNEAIAETIRRVRVRQRVDIVVLAQLSMAVFAFSYPDPLEQLGFPVLSSATTGFARVGEVLRRSPGRGGGDG